MVMFTIVWSTKTGMMGINQQRTNKTLVRLYPFFSLSLSLSLSLSHTLKIKLTYLGRQIDNNSNHIALAVSCGKRVGFSVLKRWMNTILQFNTAVPGNRFVNKEKINFKCLAGV